MISFLSIVQPLQPRVQASRRLRRARTAEPDVRAHDVVVHLAGREQRVVVVARSRRCALGGRADGSGARLGVEPCGEGRVELEEGRGYMEKWSARPGAGDTVGICEGSAWKMKIPSIVH